MLRPLLLLFATLLCLLVQGCAASNTGPKETSAQASKPLLFFQKTPCFGTCPAYNAMIYEKGSISFVGFKNALAQDTLQLQLSEQELLQLKQRIEALNYKALDRSYLTQWSDVSSTYLTFYEAGKEAKKIKHQEGGPEQLIQFQDWLHQIIWQRAEEKSLPTY